MGEMTGRPIESFGVPGNADAEIGGIREAIDRGWQWRGEMQQRRKDGSAFQASVFLSPLRNPAGRPTNWVGVIEDITSRMQMEDHLRQAQKMEAVGQLTGGVAHDFNNILAVVMTNAELIADLLPDGNKRLQGMMSAILRAVSRGASLTERLLAFSRKQELHPEPLDLAALLPDFADMLRRTLGETITVRIEFADAIPAVYADRAQFENALLNLSLNARDAMPEGGTLTISLKEADALVCSGRYGGSTCASAGSSASRWPIPGMA